MQGVRYASAQQAGIKPSPLQQVLKRCEEWQTYNLMGLSFLGCSGIFFKASVCNSTSRQHIHTPSSTEAVLAIRKLASNMYSSSSSKLAVLPCCCATCFSKAVSAFFTCNSFNPGRSFIPKHFVDCSPKLKLPFRVC